MKNESEFFKNINWYFVFIDKEAEEIKSAAGKLTNGLPCSAEYLAAHRKAATELAKVLKDDELQSYKKMAEKWNNPYAIYVQSFGLESESGTWEHSFGSSVGPCGIGSVSEC